MTPSPFHLHVPEAAIADLRERLTRTRLPDQAPGEPWTYGTDLAWMRELTAYWLHEFDWRAQEARLNASPMFNVPLAGIDLRYLHVQGVGPRPMPLLLSHGWPGSVFEFMELIPRLADPARFSGDPADAFTIVAPSLPGYGLSFAPGQPRFSVEQIAEVFATLMSETLGYRRFGTQGGDWGASISARLGLVHPEKTIGVHMNLLPLRRDAAALSGDDAAERQYGIDLKRWLSEETGYSTQQGTRPQTLANPGQNWLS